jgi:hypothetical protein
MRAVAKITSLHERTVQNAEKHAAVNSIARKTRKYRDRNSPVSVDRVNAGIWKTARAKAGGDLSKITIMSTTHVIVDI